MNNYTNKIMSKIKAIKMDGLGNQFLIIDRRTQNISIEKNKIISLSKNKNTFFDQLIFIEKHKENITPISIYNSDGNKVSACGNGARCVAYLLSDESRKMKIFLDTSERVLEAEIFSKDNVKLDMGEPLFNWNEIPLSKEVDTKNISLEVNGEKLTDGFAVNVGNPHVVFFVKDHLKYNIKKIGPLIENHELFLEKCNVTFAKKPENGKIYVNVWERGAGLTKACGTAACATAVSSFKKGLTERKTKIIFNEGILNLEYRNDNRIIMSGPVSKIVNLELEI